MHRSPSRVLRFVPLAMFVMSILPARAQQSVVQLPDFTVTENDGVRIDVHHKAGPAPNKVPVLLIHGSWGNAQTWDFPGRSVMDYLAVRGYDVYAPDLRGMGSSDNPGYLLDGLLNRVNDVAAVASYIKTTTLRVPVVMGWSQGGIIAGLLAASDPNRQLVAGVGLLSVSADGFNVPNDLLSALGALLSGFPVANPPTPGQINEIIFGTDPITGKPTISPDAFAIFVSASFLQTDSAVAIVQEVNFCSNFLNILVTACPVPTWGNITVPALVVDGALDLLVGEDRAQALFNALGSTNKQLVIYPRNSHGWFLEDNHDATMRVFDRFLSQF